MGRAFVLARRVAVAAVPAVVVMMSPLPRLEFLEVSVAATVALPTPEPVPPGELAEVQAAAEAPLGGDRVEATAEEVTEFALMAVVFDAPPTAPVMVRVKGPDGAFERWQELHAGAEDGPDAPTNYGTEPFWVEASRGYEVNLSGDDAAHAQVVLVRNETHRSVAVAEPVAGAAAAPFGINSRATWGARAPSDTPAYGSTIKLAVVHHSDSSNDYGPADVPGILRGIQAYHMDGRGWSDIAYNFVVDKFGGLWEGRGGGIDRPVVGAHAQGFNTNTVGVMVIGDYTAAQPTSAAIESVSKVIGWKLFLHGTDPASSVEFTSGGSPRYAAGVTVNLPRVVGHGDVGLTSCPGSVSGHLGSIRARAQEWTNWLRVISGPLGFVETVSSSGSSVTATGWAGDLDGDAPASVRLDVGGVSAVAAASVQRPDVTAAYAQLSGPTGFEVTATAVPPGVQVACVTALNQNYGADASLGCTDVRVVDPTGRSPDGRIDGFTPGVGALRVRGWTADADGSPARTAVLTADGVAWSSQTRSDGRFDFDLKGLPAGRRRFCVVVLNQGQGVDTPVDCATGTVGGASPLGNVDLFTQQDNLLRLEGWALDPESTRPLSVHVVWNDAQSWATPADRPRPDVGAFFPGYGDDHGFAFELRAPKGVNKLCAVAINEGVGSNVLIGCRTAVVK